MNDFKLGHRVSIDGRLISYREVLTFFNGLIECFLNLRSHIQFQQFLVVGIWIDPIGQEYVHHLLFRVCPGYCAGKSLVSESVQ